MYRLELLIVAGMILVNAVFAAYEIALASITVSRLHSLVKAGTRGAKSALLMKEGMEKSLAVVQLGITLVGLIAGATGGASAGEDIAPYLESIGYSGGGARTLAIALVVVPLTVITIVIGELVPKLFALRNKEWVCLKLSPTMQLFSFSTWPMVWLLETSASGLMNLLELLWRPQPHHDARTEAAEIQDLRAIASLARTSRLIGAREESIIVGAARLASRKLGEIMLPAQHISMLGIDQSLADCLVAAHLDMHTRFPVAAQKGEPQTIVGYVTIKDIIAVLKLNPREPSLRGILRTIPNLNADMPISTALESLLREHTHIALVRDADQQVAGLITLEDIVEELLGDIQDEYDLLPVHVVRSGNGWVVGGGVHLPRFADLTGIDLSATSTPEVHNVSGWIIGLLGRTPHGGDVVHTPGIRAIVRKVRRQRVLEALIMAEPPQQQD